MNRVPESLKNQKNGSDISDTAYYNVNIHNADESDGKIARFSENRVTPILDNPSKYEFSVVRFSVPSINIPLLFFRDDYYVKLKDPVSGTVIQTNLVWIPNATSNLYIAQGKQPVYDYSEVTQSLNIALATCYADLLAAEPGIPATEPPFFTYDATTKLFRLNAEKIGYDNDTANTVEIIISATLFNMYNNFQDFFLNANETQLLVYDTFTNSDTINGTSIFFMQQSQNTLELFADIVKIELISNSIPIRTELIGNQKDVKKRILTDFNVTGEPDKGIINFFPQGPLRWYDMLSTYPLKQIDMEFKFIVQSGEEFPIYINLGDSATAKLEFKRKIQNRLETDFE